MTIVQRQGVQALSSFFEVMLKRLIFYALIVATRGLSPLSPTINPLTADLGFRAKPRHPLNPLSFLLRLKLARV
jgi:hypothetical protein